MELKQTCCITYFEIIVLLIVPYGIETCLPMPPSPAPTLLIVPYGIETVQSLSVRWTNTLLIVPYGIETF